MSDGIHIVPKNLTITVKVLDTVFFITTEGTGGFRWYVRVEMPHSPSCRKGVVNDFEEMNKNIIMNFVMNIIIVVYNAVDIFFVIQIVSIKFEHNIDVLIFFVRFGVEDGTRNMSPFFTL